MSSLFFSSLELAFSTGNASQVPCAWRRSGSLPAAFTLFPFPVLELDALEDERRRGRDDACPELELPLWNDAGDPSRPEILEKKLARRPLFPSLWPCCCCSSACAWSLVAVPGRLLCLLVGLEGALLLFALFPPTPPFTTLSPRSRFLHLDRDLLGNEGFCAELPPFDVDPFRVREGTPIMPPTPTPIIASTCWSGSASTSSTSVSKKSSGG